jgi:hypothetical protein
VRALPGYARSYRLIRAWTYEGAALCSLSQQAFGFICVVTPGSTGNEVAAVTFAAGGWGMHWENSVALHNQAPRMRSLSHGTQGMRK